MSKVLAIITARGGSKRIPRKNIKYFIGFPIIKYSIDAAINSECFDEVMVSTDDKEIIDIAKQYGASVPFIRSNQSSNDHAVLADVIEEVLSEYKKLGKEFDYFCCLLPTAPFITSEKLKKSFKMLKESGADSLVPVVQFSFPIQRAFKIDNHNLKMFYPENMHVRSQDLEPAYHDSGQFYWMKTEEFLKQKKLFAEKTIPYKLSELEVQDIDTEEDWKIAEIKYKLINNIQA